MNSRARSRPHVRGRSSTSGGCDRPRRRRLLRGATDLHVFRLPSLPLRPTQGGDALAAAAPYLLVASFDGRNLIERNVPSRPIDIMNALDAVRDPNAAHAVVWSTACYEDLLAVLSRPLRTPLPHWRRAVYAVEPDAAALAALLGSVDLSPFFEDEAVGLFVGPSGSTDLLRMLEDHPNRPIPCVTIGLPPAFRVELAEVGKARAERVRVETARLFTELAAGAPGESDLMRAWLDGHRPLRALPTSHHTTVCSTLVPHAA